jgi:DNA-binding XRE family transcriptional regulator
VDREVKKCACCELNQFVLVSGFCRKCKQPFEVPVPTVVAIPEVLQGEPLNIMSNLYSRVLPPVLCYLRGRLGLSQLDLAKRIGLPRTYISKLETWRGVPKVKLLYSLAGALETTPSHILHLCEALVT